MNKKLLSILILTIITAALLGCHRDDTIETIDQGKVQLLVGNFKGGYGKSWLVAAKERFEAKYETFDFGNGKKGVQIIIDDDSRYSGSIEPKLQSFPQQVILAENVNYYNMVDITTAKSNYLEDISDVVNTPINLDLITGKTDESYGNTDKSISDIMNQSMKEYLDVDSNGTFFGIPFYEASIGIVYDLDVFEKYGFYYAMEGYGDEDGFIQDKSGNWIGENGSIIGNVSSMTYAEAISSGVKLSKGGDGVEGTYDDGTPATYADFFKMCERMNDLDVIPLTWPGSPEIQRYLNYLAYNLWVDYEGSEKMNVNFSLDGTVDDLIDMSSLSDDGSYKTYSETINSANGFKMQSQAGKYEGINFVYQLISNSTYYDQATCTSDTSQVEAERRYILSALPDQKDRAMLIDGSWWQNEARNIFQDMSVDYGKQYSMQNRRYGMLPLPKANESKVGEKQTIAFNTATIIMINKKAITDETTLKVAKQFIKFLETDESLYEFTKVTGSARPYSYTLSDEQLSTLTEVAKRNYELHTATDFVFTYSKNAIVRKNPERFSSSGYLVYQSGGNLNEILTLSFLNNPTLTAIDYFRSMVEDHGEEFWNNTFSKDIK